jgi:hypothetical protein
MVRPTLLRLHILFWLAAALLTLPAIGAAQDRLSDKQVKQLLEDLDSTRDRFEDQLDGSLKRATLRGPGGEVNVEAYLQDLQDNVKKLKDRFGSDSTASTEVQTVLRQASAIHGFLQTRPGVKGTEEWQRMSSVLTRLAPAYGTTFPLPEGATVRRYNDAEVAATAEAVSKGADEFYKAASKDKALSAADKQALKADTDAMKKASKSLKDLAKSGKPSAATVQALANASGNLGRFASGRQLVPGAQSLWSPLAGNLTKLGQMYGTKLL